MLSEKLTCCIPEWVSREAVSTIDGASEKSMSKFVLGGD